MATFDFLFLVFSKSLVHVFELFDGHVDRQVKNVHGKPLDGTKSIVETYQKMREVNEECHSAFAKGTLSLSLD